MAVILKGLLLAKDVLIFIFGAENTAHRVTLGWIGACSALLHRKKLFEVGVFAELRESH